MKPARPRYTRINSKVAELLALADVRKAPVPVKDIAELVGARVVFNDFNNEISGLLVRKSGDIVIGVASEQSQHRQRFTIAHELGHLLLHDGEEVHVDRDFRVNLRSAISSTAENVEEVEANAFAASLLMPMNFLVEDLGDDTVDMEDATQISE